MKVREKTILTGVYICLNRMTGLLPNNPYNTAPVIEAAYRSHEASKSLLSCVCDLRDGDLDMSEEHLDDACRVLNVVRPSVRCSAQSTPEKEGEK